MKKFLPYAGIVAPLIYLIALILGGLMRPGYSHIVHAVSELTAAGAPNRALLNPLFILYNFAVVAFGVAVFQAARAESRRRAAPVVVAISLMVIGVLGVLLQLFFPQDPGGPAVTFAGTMHLIVSGITALGTMIAVPGAALWLRARGERSLALHSFITVIVIFAGGLAGAASAAAGSPLMGLFERVPILSFQQWLLVVSLGQFQRSLRFQIPVMRPQE